MEHLSYEASKKRVVYGFWLLFILTLIEVFFSLLGKGHIIGNSGDYRWLIWVTIFLIIGLSIYKAYFIVFEFMHMKYEVKGLAYTVLIPTLLLAWGLIAFSQEGKYWQRVRNSEKNKIEIPVENGVGYIQADIKEWSEI